MVVTGFSVLWRSLASFYISQHKIMIPLALVHGFMLLGGLKTKPNRNYAECIILIFVFLYG